MIIKKVNRQRSLEKTVRVAADASRRRVEGKQSTRMSGVSGERECERCANLVISPLIIGEV